MKTAVLGTGSVGTAIGSALIRLGHDVRMGSRTPNNPTAMKWTEDAGGKAGHGTFSDAAAFGELVVNCTAGNASVAALESADEANLAGKVLLDVANPLSFGNEGVTLSVCNTDSLGEQIQRRFPDTRVVKGLNTITSQLMFRPADLSEPGIIPICGNDPGAKDTVKDLLVSAGWPSDSIVDLGDITNARGTEAYLLYWVRLFQTFQTPRFNIAVGRASNDSA